MKIKNAINKQEFYNILSLFSLIAFFFPWYFLLSTFIKLELKDITNKKWVEVKWSYMKS